MNFWKKLFGAGARVEPASEAPDLVDADAQADTLAAQNFVAFIGLLSKSLAPEASSDEAQGMREAARIAWQTSAAQAAAQGSSAGADAYAVLQELMGVEHGQHAQQWLLIHVDWRASDEIGWQVEHILARSQASSQVPAVWDGADAEFDSVPHAFAALAPWLQARGLALLHIETDADEYCACIVDEADTTQARQLAEGAGLPVYDPTEFAERNGVAAKKSPASGALG